MKVQLVSKQPQQHLHVHLDAVVSILVEETISPTQFLLRTYNFSFAMQDDASAYIFCYFLDNFKMHVRCK